MDQRARPRPSSQREAQRRSTRERLLRAASKVFLRDGFLAARTSDIARAARLSHGSVFVHFPTRDALLAAAIEKLGDALARRIHDLAEADASVAEILQGHLAGLMEHEALYARLVSESPVLPSTARGALVGIQSAVAFHLSAAAEREMAAGRLRRVPLPLLFNTWLGLVHHYLINRDLFAPHASVLQRHGRTLVRHYLGLLAP